MKNIKTKILSSFVVLFLFLTVVRLHLLNSSYATFDDGFTLKAKKPESYLLLKEIDYKIRWAVVVSEDWAFHQHKGVDWDQLNIVLEDWKKTGILKRGASTITQQLIKNLYLFDEPSFIRKAIEIPLALILEKLSTKDKILEQYLNIAHLGPDIYGVEAAAQYYFRKSAKYLNWRQAVFLANLLPSPLRYGESFKRRSLTHFMLRQERKLLQKLKMAGVLKRSSYPEYESLGFRR